MYHRISRMYHCTRILHLRFEETHKYFGKMMYAMTAKRTKNLEAQLFRAAVYHDQIDYLCAEVFAFMHPMVHYNDTFFPAARTSPNAQNPGTQAGQPPRPCSGMETARALRGHDTEIRGDGRRTKKNGASSHHHYVRNVPLRCCIRIC